MRLMKAAILVSDTDSTVTRAFEFFTVSRTFWGILASSRHNHLLSQGMFHGFHLNFACGMTQHWRIGSWGRFWESFTVPRWPAARINSTQWMGASGLNHDDRLCVLLPGQETQIWAYLLSAKCLSVKSTPAQNPSTTKHKRLLFTFSNALPSLLGQELTACTQSKVLCNQYEYSGEVGERLRTLLV